MEITHSIDKMIHYQIMLLKSNISKYKIFKIEKYQNKIKSLFTDKKSAKCRHF